MGGEDQRDAEGAAQPRDALELGAVIRVGRDHLGKFVYDDKQVRESLRQGFIALIRRLLAILHQVLHATACQQGATLFHDRLDRHEHALHGVGLQVSENVHHVRQFLERLEGCTALEVHEHEVDEARIVFDGQARDEREQ